MKVQKNKPLVTVVVVAAGSLVGAMFASILTSGSGMLGRYSFGDAVRDWIILSVGALLGGLLFSWASKR
jgi:cell shape-determining protein MreD